MQMISLGSARASRVDRGALAPVGARHGSLNGGDSTRLTRTARADREANRCPSGSVVRPQHARARPVPNPTEFRPWPQRTQWSPCPILTGPSEGSDPEGACSRDPAHSRFLRWRAVVRLSRFWTDRSRGRPAPLPVTPGVSPTGFPTVLNVQRQLSQWL